MRSAHQRYRNKAFPLAALFVACALCNGVASAQDSDLDDDMKSVEFTPVAASDATDSDNAADTEIGPGDEGWIDGGHDYASRKANEMTQWVDNFLATTSATLNKLNRDYACAPFTTGMSGSITRLSSVSAAKSACRKSQSDSIWSFAARTWTTSVMMALKILLKIASACSSKWARAMKSANTDSISR